MPFLDPIRNFIFKKAKNRVWGRLEPHQIESENLRIEKKKIQPNQAYVSVVLHRTQIVHTKILFDKLYGVVHSFIALPIYAKEEAKFNVVNTPNNLQNIDKKNLDRVVQGDTTLLGCIPYRGGKIDMELGLFAVKTENLLDSYLGLLGELADAASVDYVKQAIPFVAPIQKGISMLLGVGSDSTLLVGMQGSLTPTTGYYVITDAEKNSTFDLKKLRLRDDCCLYTDDGKPFEGSPYMVFSIETQSNRHTWFDIPEIADAFSNLQLAIRSGTPKSIEENFDIFEKALLSSPDLLIADARKIRDTVFKQLVEPWITTEPEKRIKIPDITIHSYAEFSDDTKAINPVMLALLGTSKKLEPKDREVAMNLNVFHE